jgi:O-antigen/teichoic acid export membrane protein
MKHALPSVVDLAQIKRNSTLGALSYFARTLLIQGIGLVSTLVLSAYLSPEDFGVFGVVTVIIGLLVFFSDIGLAAALIQKKTEPTVVEYRTTFTVQQILAWCIVAVIIALIQSGLLSRLDGTDGIWILVALGLAFPLATLKTIPSIILERQLSFSKLVVPQIFEQLVFHGVLIYLAFSGFGVIMYAYAVILRSIVGVIVMTMIQPWSFGFAFDKAALKQLLSFGVQFQLNDLLARIKDQLYYLVLAFFLPLNQFGYIQWAKNWSMYPYALTVQNIMSITFPTFSRLQDNKQALARAIEKTLFFITLAIFPILAGMSIFIIPLIAAFPVYEKWLPAATALILFNAGTAWSALSTPLTNTLNATGKISITLRLMVMWTILTWVLTPPAIWYFGFNGVAVAAFIISCTSIIPIWYVKKMIAFSVWDQVWRQLLGVVVMVLVGLAGWSYWQSGLFALIQGIVVVGVSYLATMAFTGWRKVLLEVTSIRRAIQK